MSKFYAEPAENAQEQLRRWDEGSTIWSVEMGGLGPGYEQAIQVLAIEIVRDNLHSSLPDKTNWSTWADETVSRLDRKQPDGSYLCGGFSGAQVGAAKKLAFDWLKNGPANLLQRREIADRKIQVSNFWPHA